MASKFDSRRLRSYTMHILKTTKNMKLAVQNQESASPLSVSWLHKYMVSDWQNIFQRVATLYRLIRSRSKETRRKGIIHTEYLLFQTLCEVLLYS